MSVLTRLAEADPARGIATDTRPDLDELIARAERETPVETVPVTRPSRLRTLAPIAAVVAAVLVAAGVVVFRHSDATDRPVHAGYGAVASDFPVDAKPRPIVLIGDSIIVGGFPSGDTKIAFMNGQIDLDTAYPTPSTSQDGLPLLPANAAFARLTSLHQCCATTSTRLRLVEISLTHHKFDTDRGVRSLPAWEFDFAGVPQAVYVLAVSAAGLYGGSTASAGDATLSADGRRLTVWVVTHHASKDGCDIGYRQTLSSTEGTHGVRLVVHTSYDKVPPRSQLATIGASTGYFCDDVAHAPHPPRSPHEGEANTTTIQLDKPLGNRIVVDAKGRPYVVTR